MANTVLQIGRACGGRRWRVPTRGDLLTFLVAAMLCSASYYLAIWHNSRGAADSRVLGPSASSCGGVGGARAAVDADEPLDFEAHHAAESAGLSVSASASAASTMMTTGARRALSGGGASGAVARTGNPVAGAEASAAAGER
jgi:hypothetical protein